MIINTLLILLVALFVFCIYRFGLLVLDMLLTRYIFPNTQVPSGPTVYIPIYIVFISCLTIAILYVSHNRNMTNLEWYTTFTLYGLSSIIWCYFDWDLSSFLSKPQFTPPTDLQIKKIFIFSLVLIASISLGYLKVLDALNVQRLSTTYKILDITIITSTIAADRVLSQIYSYVQDKKHS
ncbi:hypothetical protein QTL86_02575 [Cellulosilyticum sp. ST5]|uniref:hypothetical protein n=1 Tax=Cellulosilyticum sp. ST5 TaxID=3055805 RepID=UPI0039779751